MESTPTPRCKQHPEAPAGWLCEDCGAALCPQCTELRRAQTVEYFACGLCGGTAKVLRVHRSATPYTRHLRGLWRYRFSPSGLQTLAGLSAFTALCSWLTQLTWLFMKFVPLVIGFGTFWAYFFHVLRTTARGVSQLEAPDYSDVFNDIVIPALRGFVATSLLWLPGLLYVLFLREALPAVADSAGAVTNNPAFFVNGVRPDAPHFSLGADPFLLLIVLAGCFYLPMALMLAASGHGLLGMLNPVRVIGHALDLGRDYLRAVGAMVLLLVLHGVLHVVAMGVRAIDIFLLSRWLAETLTLIAPIMMARALGLLLYVRGDAVGYGLESDYYEPALPGAEPLAKRPAPFRHAQLVPDSELPPAEQPLPGALPDLATLAQAIEARDIAQALALYPALHAVPDAKKAVTPAQHLFVGQAAASQGQYELAVQALETAADIAPDEPTAPRALVMLARVYGERLQEPERAEGIYRYIVHRYPDTDASRFAAQRLPATAS